MESKSRNHNDPRKRFFKWAMNKMTGEEAFDIFYGEKGKDYPEAMKKEFSELFESTREARKKLHRERKDFMEKWHEYAAPQCDRPSPDGQSEERMPGYGTECHRHGYGHGHRGGHAFFGF